MEYTALGEGGRAAGRALSFAVTSWPSLFFVMCPSEWSVSGPLLKSEDLCEVGTSITRQCLKELRGYD